MSNKDKASLMPKLRFPEFQSAKGWTSRELGDCLDYLQPTQYLVNSTAYSDNYEIPVVTAGKTFILGYTNETEGVFGQPLPVIIFDDFTTATQYVDFRFKAKSSAMKILLAKQNANIKFIYESMQQIDYEVGAHGRHWISTYSKIKVSVPEPEEQQKIADCLSSLDELIAAQARKVGALKTHKKGLMQRLFPDDGTTQPSVRFPEFESAGNWDVRRLDSIGRVIRGASPRPQGDPRYYGGPVPRLMVQDVTRDGKWVTPRIDSLTNEGAKLSRPCLAGTLTIVCSGTVGVVSFLAIDACIHDGFLALIDIDETIATRDFLYHSLSSLRLQFEEGATHGGVFTNLTTSVIQQFQIKCPPTAEQQRIAACLSDLDAVITAEVQKIDILKCHKKGLMQQLFPSPEDLKND
jgi:type I restriction enzyme, S subunit